MSESERKEVVMAAEELVASLESLMERVLDGAGAEAILEAEGQRERCLERVRVLLAGRRPEGVAAALLDRARELGDEILRLARMEMDQIAEERERLGRGRRAARAHQVPRGEKAFFVSARA